VLAPATAACCILTAGLGNTSFVGFPLLKALYGQEALQYAILADQPGSFLLLSTFGLGLAARYRRAAASGPPVWKKLLRFPPFMAFGMGLLLIPVGLPAILKPLLEPLAATLTPLALLSVGLQWQPGRGHFSRRALALGLVYKLVAGPLLAWLLLRALGLSGGLMFEVAVLEAAMAPMITASIVAAEHELAPSLAYQMVGVGIPLSLVTVLLWYLLLAS
jgi:predicted permease